MNQKIFLGPPGTGKTTRLLKEVQQFIDEGYSPHEIAFMSFTRKAANEARERALVKFPHLSAKDLPYWATLHSVAFRRLKMGRNDVLQRSDWLAISKKTGFEMQGYYNLDDGGLAGGTKKGDKFLFNYGLAHARMVEPVAHHASLPFSDRSEMPLKEFLYFIDTLRLYKAETGLLDFNDMLEYALHTGHVEGVKIAIIDEAQDLSKRQWLLVDSLFGNCERIIIAGDDDQSIYEWSGADVPTFLTLAGDRTVLDRSYRLPRSIFDFSNQIVSRVRNRIEKTWGPDDREGEVRTVTRLEELKDRMVENNGESWLLLGRNKYILDDQVKLLQSWGIPYSVKGVPAAQQNELRAIRAFERARAGKEIQSSEAQSFYNFLHGGVQIARGFKQLPAETPEIIGWDWLVKHGGLKVSKDDAWFDVLKIDKNMISYYRAIRRHGYATTEEPKVNVSTIHSVKGGEADNVILIDAMASRTYREFEENPDAEHRVQYVAATRARERLFIMKTGERSFYPFPQQHPAGWNISQNSQTA